MVKIGDKVRFLSAVGGGVVVKQLNSDTVMVREEDGFETPMLIRECVVVATGEAKPKGGSAKAVVEESSFAAEDTYQEEMPLVETKEGEKLTVLLAYVPNDRRNLQSTTFDAYLVNDSNYYLFFSYLTQGERGWDTRYAGLVEPNTSINMETFSRDSLNGLERVAIQYVAFKKSKHFALKQPLLVEHRIDTVKFYKLHSFRANDYFEQDALIYNIVRNDIPERPLALNAQDMEESLRSKKQADSTPAKPILSKSSKPSNEVVEVDLHIHELLDSTTGLSNGDMLNYQLDHVRKILALYKSKRGQKIVFIHGKGDGVLRKALEKELRLRYSSYSYQDASFREYGFGATMVIIK